MLVKQRMMLTDTNSLAEAGAGVSRDTKAQLHIMESMQGQGRISNCRRKDRNGASGICLVIPDF